MNWGKAIIIAFIAFGGFIGSLVYRMATTKVDLVRTDYYQTEMKYQQQIDRIRHSQQTSETVQTIYKPNEQLVQFEIPTTAHKGEIQFFRPSDAKLDFTVPLSSGTQTVATNHLQTGYWKVKVTWSDGKQEYYKETDLSL
ncbi:MAG: FixH family protein [Siphonobacter sp.]